jgi:hypothetical protein
VTIGDSVFVGRKHDPVVQEQRHRARERHERRLQLRIFSAAASSSARALLAAYCYVIGGDHDFSDPS